MPKVFALSKYLKYSKNVTKTMVVENKQTYLKLPNLI